jgi:methylated-DNA-protein-cysteine methyltransferase related protein
MARIRPPRAEIAPSMKRKLTSREAARKLLRAPRSEQRDAAIRRVVRQIPRGKVATYGQVAAAAGYPLYHRQVVQVLRKSGGALPWQRVVGAGGAIKLKYEAALEQRTRLELEGVRFRGKRVDMAEHQHVFRQWEWND